MRKLRITNHDALDQALRSLANRSEELRYFHRLHVVSLVAMGCSCYKVAAWYKLTARTVERWVSLYQEKGCSGLRGDHDPGRPAKLSESELEKIVRDVRKSPRELGYKEERWRGCVLAKHLRETFDISLGERQCQRLIKQYSPPGDA